MQEDGDFLGSNGNSLMELIDEYLKAEENEEFPHQETHQETIVEGKSLLLMKGTGGANPQRFKQQCSIANS